MYSTEQRFYLNCILLIISFLRQNLKLKHDIFPPLEAGVIGSEFRTNFILFDSPEGVNFTNLGCQPQDRNSRYHLALKGRNFKLYRSFRAGEVDLFRVMG